ncbi:MAG: AraC family transcriptional regulator [Spirochaetes bacterium]|nr:AraC family transcriptional regulator [Spirochaetota bacterium]
MVVIGEYLEVIIAIMNKSGIKKKKYLILTILVQIVIIVYLSLNLKTNYLFFPNDNIEIQTTTHLNEIGSVKINSFVQAIDYVSIDFTLYKINGLDFEEFPRAALQFIPKNNSLFDLSIYDNLDIELHSTVAQTLDLTIREEIPNYSIAERVKTYKHYKYEIPVWKDQDVYSIKIDDLQIPEWWFKDNGLSRYDVLAQRDLTRIRDIIIGNEIAHPFNTLSSITVKKIALSGINTLFLYILVAIAFIDIFFACVLWVYRKFPGVINKFNIDHPVLYKKIDYVSTEEIDEQLLIEFLQQNFNHVDMSVEFVGDYTHISQKRIPQIIKKLTGLTFPKYIHKLRIEKAKQLLRETDKKVIDIAHDVGYNSINSFNEFFKRFEKTSPLKYRKGAGTDNNDNKKD